MSAGIQETLFLNRGQETRGPQIDQAPPFDRRKSVVRELQNSSVQINKPLLFMLKSRNLPARYPELIQQF